MTSAKPNGLNSLHLCGIFECSPQLEKRFSFASTELWVKRFLLRQVELKCVRLKAFKFCSCKSLLLFLFAFPAVVCAKLRLKVFIFYSTINHRKGAHHTPFKKMRGRFTSRMQHSFRLANVCQMCSAGQSLEGPYSL